MTELTMRLHKKKKFTFGNQKRKKIDLQLNLKFSVK